MDLQRRLQPDHAARLGRDAGAQRELARVPERLRFDRGGHRQAGCHDPEWGDGAVGFAWGIYYVALPESVGGDLERSRTILDGLVAARPDALLPRWGRGKYFHTRTRDKEACRRDLEWVVSQDPRRAPGKLAWNVYFHADASLLLERLDAMFAKRRPR